MGPLIRLDWALLRASWPARLAVLVFALASTLAVAAGLQWQDRYEAVAEPERQQVRQSAEKLYSIFDGMADGTVTPFDLRRPQNEWPLFSEYVFDPQDPYAASFYYQQLAYLPPGPVMALAQGVTPLLPNHVLIYTQSLNVLFQPGAAPERTNPALLALGRFDLLAVILILVPLMAIAILHDAKAREREAGIFPMLQSLGVKSSALFNRRLVFRGGLLLAIVALSVIVAGVVSGAAAGRLALFTLMACIYALFWAAITGAIAAKSRSAVGSAALSLALFAALVLVGPGVAESLARPDGLLKPRALVDAEIRALAREWGPADRDDDRIQFVAETYWGLNGGVFPDCADYRYAFEVFSNRRLADQAFSEAQASAHDATTLLDRRLDALAVLVPPLGFRRAMEAIAGSSAARAQAFERSVVDYHAQWRDRATDDLINCRRWDRATFDPAPAYVWKEPDPGPTTLAYALAGLLLWTGLSLFLVSRTND
ncbi:MAG: DUF3526 domain-containing protein [Pseudomonadota bacterium]